MTDVKINTNAIGVPNRNKHGQFVFSKEGVNFAHSIDQMTQLEELIKLIKSSE